MNEIEHENMETIRGIGQSISSNLEALLNEWGAKNVNELNKFIYDDSECGASLSVRLHNGKWKYSGDLDRIKNDNIGALRITSIVEGSDAEVFGDVIELIDYNEPKKLLKDFSDSLKSVNNEACIIWDDVNA